MHDLVKTSHPISELDFLPAIWNSTAHLTQQLVLRIPQFQFQSDQNSSERKSRKQDLAESNTASAAMDSPL